MYVAPCLPLPTYMVLTMYTIRKTCVSNKLGYICTVAQLTYCNCRHTLIRL